MEFISGNVLVLETPEEVAQAQERSGINLVCSCEQCESTIMEEA